MAHAHTDGDAFILWRKANVVHTGDVFFSGRFPFIDVSSGGSIDGLIAATDVLLTLGDDNVKIIPGHGVLSDRAAVRASGKMLTTVRDRVRQQKAAGRSLAQTLATRPTAEFDASWGPGFIKPAQFVTMVSQSEATTRLHSATHLLHAALRRVLGPTVQQKGSNITPERLRFDFSHPARLTPEQLGQVEALVNEQIQANLPVTVEMMPLVEALAAGALAFFGEKYGEQVKVYSAGDFSKEVCGGPHVARTGELGRLRVVKEEAVGAGVRRIRAVLEPKR